MTPIPRILHIHPSFDRGGTALRCVRLINAFGGAAFNALISGEPDKRRAAALIEPMVAWAKFPRLTGRPWPWRLKAMAAAMQGYDLVCTYGWGAIDAVLAHTLFADVYKLPPLVHHEDGFDADGAARRKPRRDVLPALVKRKGELWVGTPAGPTGAENLPALVRAIAFLGDEWQLVVPGEGPERAAVLAAAEQQGIEHRVHLPGSVADPAS